MSDNQKALQEAAPTREQVENLKSQWAADGTWDIEDTPGFGACRDELLAYRKEVEAERDRQEAGMLTLKALDLGCPGNLDLAAYVLRLERRIDDLSLAVENMYFSRSS